MKRSFAISYQLLRKKEREGERERKRWTSKQLLQVSQKVLEDSLIELIKLAIPGSPSINCDAPETPQPHRIHRYICTSLIQFSLL